MQTRQSVKRARHQRGALAQDLVIDGVLQRAQPRRVDRQAVRAHGVFRSCPAAIQCCAYSSNVMVTPKSRNTWTYAWYCSPSESSRTPSRSKMMARHERRSAES